MQESKLKICIWMRLLSECALKQLAVLWQLLFSNTLKVDSVVIRLHVKDATDSQTFDVSTPQKFGFPRLDKTQW